MLTNVDNSRTVSAMDIDPIDFFPGYYHYCCMRRRPNWFRFTSISFSVAYKLHNFSKRTHTLSSFLGICTHFLAMVFAVAICAGVLYYYDTYMKNTYGSLFSEMNKRIPEERKICEINREMEKFKRNLQQTDVFRKRLDNIFGKIYSNQKSIVDEKIEKALDLYNADKVGLFDYASEYAGASIVATPGTFAYPANKSLSIFNVFSVDIMSNPEYMLQTNNVPGNCFAFYGTTGRIRIRLGKKIKIRAVTLDHMKLLEDASSAPKDFEVYGLDDPFDISGLFLGRFVYNLKGRPFQTFKIQEDFIKDSFEYVELYILTNHGRLDFTCVYRFRVHNDYPQ